MKTQRLSSQMDDIHSRLYRQAVKWRNKYFIQSIRRHRIILLWNGKSVLLQKIVQATALGLVGRELVNDQLVRFLKYRCMRSANINARILSLSLPSRFPFLAAIIAGQWLMGFVIRCGNTILLYKLVKITVWTHGHRLTFRRCALWS